MEQTYTTYEQFGAVGDGMTDDMPAIVACHEYANAHGLTVVGRDDANYYIGGRDLTATVRTNVRWGQAHFTVDDRVLENIHNSLFHVAPDAEPVSLSLPPLRHGQRQIDFPHEGNLFIRVTDDTRMIYIRKGLNQNNGTPVTDSFVADAEGNIIGDINWDYDSYTDIYAIPADDTPITLEGGIFTTIANEQESFYNYHSRNIYISRSHVTVRDLTHHITGEGDHGAPYSGFITIANAWRITLQDCLMTPHKTYMTPSKIPGQMVAMGSYDLSVRTAIEAHFLRLRQTIDITDSRYWGLMGSNFSKKVIMEDCVISRFDAHMGVTDCVIRRCELGHMGINLIGFGRALIEDTIFRFYRTVSFRADYGSFFHGELIMRNCTWIPTELRERRPVEIIGARNEGDHDFGYVCGMPERIVIDNLIIDDTHIDDPTLSYALFPDYDDTFAPNKPYPYGTPREMVLCGIRALSGREITLCRRKEEYPHLQSVSI